MGPTRRQLLHGMDAALTDHATIGQHLPGSPCGGDHDCQSVAGIDEAAWGRTGQLADGADENGRFTAIRGFEWSSPTLGHMNVWFSADWTDPLHTGGLTTGEGFGAAALPPELAAVVDGITRRAPTSGTTMRPFYEWLAADPAHPVLGGGADGIAGFNHPGREPGRFGYFQHDPALVARVVSCEVFNRHVDFLFEGTDAGAPSPISECLDAGWRVGLLGVTDEHGTAWGSHRDKGRAGLWVRELSRAGVREALLARRFFATTVTGLRLDATAASRGRRARMGSLLPHGTGTVRFALDVDRGAAWDGKPLRVQVLRPGRGPLPEVVHAEDLVVRDGGTVTTFDVPLDVEDGRWAFLRVTDPEAQADPRARGEYATAGRGVACASPFFLDPGAAG